MEAPDTCHSLRDEPVPPYGIAGEITELGETDLKRRPLCAPHLYAEVRERGEYEIGRPLQSFVAQRPRIHLESPAGAESSGNARKQPANNVKAVLSAVGVEKVSHTRRDRLEWMVHEDDIEAILRREGLE